MPKTFSLKIGSYSLWFHPYKYTACKLMLILCPQLLHNTHKRESWWWWKKGVREKKNVYKSTSLILAYILAARLHLPELCLFFDQIAVFIFGIPLVQVSLYFLLIICQCLPLSVPSILSVNKAALCKAICHLGDECLKGWGQLT